MRSGFVRVCGYGLGIVIMVAIVAAPAWAAAATAAPEIDGTSLSAGLGVLTTGALLLRSRRQGSK